MFFGGTVLVVVVCTYGARTTCCKKHFPKCVFVSIKSTDKTSYIVSLSLFRSTGIPWFQVDWYTKKTTKIVNGPFHVTSKTTFLLALPLHTTGTSHCHSSSSWNEWMTGITFSVRFLIPFPRSSEPWYARQERIEHFISICCMNSNKESGVDYVKISCSSIV